MQVHLIDGTYELFRNHFGAPPATGPDGREVGAARGLARSLAALLRQPGVTHVGIAFDHVIESFRNDLFAGYKTGAGIDPDLLAQFGLAEDAARALGLAVWPMVEHEADDALATAAACLAREPAAEVERIVIGSPDKDLAQCVRGQRVVLWDRRRDLVLDERAVIAKWGVPPRSIPDLLALIGDDADGIPGLPGWGAKGAATVLAAHGAIEAIPDDPARWAARPRGADRLAETLRSRRADALLYKRLATLVTDCPIDCGLDALRWRGPRDAELERVAHVLGDPELPGRLPAA